VSDSNVATPISACLRPPVQQLLQSWHRAFPGEASQVREARRFLAHCLAGCAVADDAVTCLSELAANAVLHSNSRLPGGSFTVHAGRGPSGRLRVEVVDQGGPWTPGPDLSGQHGRGLLIVARLAADWGIISHHDGRTAWLELDAS
jgi:serine/threonine-protein kinase RsbW